MRFRAYRRRIALYLQMAVVLLSGAIAGHHGMESQDISANTGAANRIVAEVRFGADIQTEDPLLKMGFCPLIRKGAIRMSVGPECLSIWAAPGSRMLYSQAMKPTQAHRLVIEWGVRRFPNGIDWGNGSTKREPLGVALSFGADIAMPCAETRSFTGMILLALERMHRLVDPPRSIVVFLGQQPWHGRMLEGNFYRKKIRYYCQSSSQTDSFAYIQTNLSIDTLYRFAFGKRHVKIPQVNAISIELDLDGLADSSEAFIRTVRLERVMTAGEAKCQLESGPETHNHLRKKQPALSLLNGS